jgi:hypothetical protein
MAGSLAYIFLKLSHGNRKDGRARIAYMMIVTNIILPVESLIQLVPGVLSPGVKWLGCEVNTYLHMFPRLRMSGAISLLPLYDFMSWTLLLINENLLIVC